MADSLNKDEHTHIKGRMEDFEKHFKSFADATPEALKEYLSKKGRQKTVSHWRGTLSDFFKYCIRKDAIKTNPIDKLHKDDFVKAEKPAEVGYLSLIRTNAFMAHIEAKYPHLSKFYALALFAGIRVEETPRIKEEYIRYSEKKLILPAEITKTGKAAVLERLPANVWAWLEKYKGAPILTPSKCIQYYYLPINPHNFARHSFATYHLSLYIDEHFTASITRHDRPETLRKNYFGALVPKAEAKAYFAITPQSVKKWAAENPDVLENIKLRPRKRKGEKKAKK